MEFFISEDLTNKNVNEKFSSTKHILIKGSLDEYRRLARFFNHVADVLNVFAVLVFLYLIVGFSFFVMATRVLYWATGLGMILICNPIFEKIACLIGGKSIEK
jgi:hypothetical protein